MNNIQNDKSIDNIYPSHSAAKKSGANVVLFFLCIAVFISTSGLFLVLQVDNNLVKEQGVSSVLNGVSVAVHYLFIALAALFLGKFIRRFGIKNVIYTGFIFLAVGSYLHIISTYYLAIFAYRLIEGIGSALVFVSTETWLNHASPDDKRSRNLAIYGFSFSSGFLFAPLGPKIFDSSGLLFLDGPALTFSLAGTACLIAIIWCALFIKKPEDLKTEDIPIKNWIKQIPVPSFTALIYGVMESSFVAHLYYYGRKIDLDKDQSNLLISAPLVGGLIFMIPIGLLADRFGRRKILKIVSVLATACFLILILIPQEFLPIFVLLIFAGGTVGSFYTIGLSLIGEKIESDKLAHAIGFYSFMFGFGTIIGPIIAGMLLDTLNQYGMFSFLGLLTLFLVLLAIFVKDRQSVK